MRALSNGGLQARLSNSTVRGVTRVVGVVEEERLCRPALTATASQLARMVSAYRSAAGSRAAQQQRRRVTWHLQACVAALFAMELPVALAA